MAEFIDVAEDLLTRRNGIEGKEHFEKVFQAIGNLQIAQAKTQLDLTNIESVLSAFEMARIIGRMPKVEAEAIESLALSVRKVIVHTLEETMRFPVEGEQVLPPRCYEQFADLVYEMRTNVDPRHKVSIISFNYDIGLDYALYFKRIPFDYCIHAGDEDSSNVPVLKLHGSLNWAYCNDCNEALPFTFEEFFRKYHFDFGLRNPHWVKIQMSDALKNVDHSEFEHPFIASPLIVPPVINKTDQYLSMQNVWKRAAKELSEAENIFISGYSLPETDIFFRYLFSLGTIGKKPLRRVWVFDTDQTGEVEKRFRGLLGTGALERFKYIKARFFDLPATLKKEFESK